MAMRTLANQFVIKKKDRLLEALLVERGRHHPADAWTLSYEGERYRWKAGIYLVRCLARLKRSDKAIEEAETLLKARQVGAVLVVLAHASTGDAKKAIAAVERQQDRYLVEDCYRDDELGPLLRTEAFAEFRARFPEAKPGMLP